MLLLTQEICFNIFLISSWFVLAQGNTDNVAVGSCAVGRRVADCGYNTMTECMDTGCCWDENTIPACVKPVMRTWGPCSAKCRHRGRAGGRVELTQGWTMPCNSFPCRLRTACVCNRMDLVILLDASSEVNEQNFWESKQLVMDIISAYKQTGHDTRVALITYDTGNHVIFGFKDGYSLDDVHGLLQRIWEIPYKPKGTASNLLTGLSRAKSVISSGRPDVQHICLVVSGGKASRPWKIPEAVTSITETGAIIHAVHPGYITSRQQGDFDKDIMKSLVISEHHMFTLDDYNDRTALVTAVVSLWCCPDDFKNSINAIFDDESDIYINGVFHSHVTFKETAAFIVPDKPKNLISLRIDNILNPDGRYFELWNTAARGLTVLSLPYQWKCWHREEEGWYSLEFDDSGWKKGEVTHRMKDRMHIGPRGQQRMWSSGGNWTAYCRGWTRELCNVTRMREVTCTSVGNTMWFGGCQNVFDGAIKGRSGDWMTTKAKEVSITINFTRIATIRELGIMNRCTFKGQVKDLVIHFSDGSTHSMSLPCNAYSIKIDDCDGMDYSWMTFDPPILSSSVMVEVVSVCFPPGQRQGLREIQVLGEPPCW